MLRPLADDQVEAVAVSTRVNNVKNEDAACLAPVSQGELDFG
jgi:putative SOS response-associated peptidase YedK